MNMKNKKVGIVGFGHLGQAISTGLTKAGYDVIVNNGNLNKTRIKIRRASLNTVRPSNLPQIAKNCSTIFLCIKHDQLFSVASSLSLLLNESHLVISCLAQSSLSESQSFFAGSNSQIVKFMTTLGVCNRKGVSAYQTEKDHQEKLDCRAKKLLKTLSATNCLLKLESEEEMQLFTTLVGCFPGIMAYLLHQLELSATKHGGKSFVQYGQMFSTLLRSTAGLLDSAGSAEELEYRVKTRGGVTEAIVNELAQNSEIYDNAVIAGLHRMSRRSE